MHSIFTLLLSTFFFLTSLNTVNADERGLNVFGDQIPSIDQESQYNLGLEQKIQAEKSLDEILGPKDIFPFLPDNHRDSGTGKFSRFN